MKGYSARDIATMLGLSPSQVRSYVDDGFISAQKDSSGEPHFTFHDIVLLRTARELLAAKIPKRKITTALQNLQRQLPNGRPMTAVRISAIDDKLVVRDGDTLWRPESGQLLFDFSVSELENRVRPFAERAAEVARAQAESHDAEAWFALGVELEIGAPDDALQAYRKAVELDARHADAHVNLGRMLHEKRARVEAEKHYRLAIAADRDHATAWFNLALVLEELRRIDEAIEAYREAIRIEPAFADAHYNLAGVYEDQGQRNLAYKHLKQYKQLIEG